MMQKKTKIDRNASFNEILYILTVKLIWSNLLNQLNLVIYIVKFETLSLMKF